MDVSNLPRPGALLVYERVRVSGRFNMLDPRARTATGLDETEYLSVIQNYGALKEMYPHIIAKVKRERERNQQSNAPRWKKHTF